MLTFQINYMLANIFSRCIRALDVYMLSVGTRIQRTIPAVCCALPYALRVSACKRLFCQFKLASHTIKRTFKRISRWLFRVAAVTLTYNDKSVKIDSDIHLLIR